MANWERSEIANWGWSLLRYCLRKKLPSLTSMVLVTLLVGSLVFPGRVTAQKKDYKYKNFLHQNINEKAQDINKVISETIIKGDEPMKYELPPLPYEYNALEPYLDENTLRLHHDNHHAAYVKGLNTALEKLQEAREKGDYALIHFWERNLAFNGSGHILHSIFWTNLSPGGGGMPTGELSSQITRDFGNFESFRNQLSEAAAAVEGSGWAILGWVDEFQKLVILQVENHQKLTLWGITPLLVLDVWEHAYYLKYQNRRTEWITNWWKIINWEDVAKRFKGSGFKG